MSYNGYRHIHYNPKKGQIKLWTWDTATSDAVSNGVRAEKSVAEAKALREAIIESLTEIDRQTGEICPLCSEERPSHQDHCPVITLNTALLLREDKQDAPHA